MIQRLFKNQYSFSIISKFTLVFLGVINSILINRGLGPALKGEYVYILNLINIFTLVLNLGIYHSYPFYRRTMDDEQLKDKFYNTAVFQFIVYLLIAIVVSFACGRMDLAIYITLVPFMILKRQLMFITLVENINLRNKINLISETFYTLAIALLFFFAPQNYLLLILIRYIIILFVIVALRTYNHFKLDWNKVEISFMVETVKFGIFPMLSSLLITMNYKFDIVLLKLFVDYEQIGLYTVGVSLANQIWLIPDAFKDVLFSKMAKSDAIQDTVLSIKINMLISLFLVFGILIFGRSFLTLLYGMEYVGSYGVTVIIFIGIIPMIYFKLLTPLYMANGMQRQSFIILLGSVSINVLGNILLIPRFGIGGAAFSSVLSYSICGGLFLTYYVKISGVDIKRFFLFSKEEREQIKGFMKVA